MSGFEAIGLACNIFQTISFARDTFLTCRDIYNGQKTPDSSVEEKAAAMIQASHQVEVSCRILSSTEERALVDIALECTATAKELESMVQTITKIHRKGSILRALGARLKSSWKKSDVENLEKALARQTETMQLLLINRICSQTKASQLRNQASFQQLNERLQAFILQIEAGYTQMKELLQMEGQTTREHITEEVQRTEESVKHHVTKEIRSYETLKGNGRQRERLLRSLRFPEMNERRNNITEPEDATFQRVFKSYGTSAKHEGGSSSSHDRDEIYHRLDEIDRIWQSFTAWLQSEQPLFWIQGKPGSGKSTLVKHIIAHERTACLLHEWRPHSIIVSHYFYLIGATPLQSNVIGFYSSLIVQLLASDASSAQADFYAQRVLEQLPLAASKEYLADWSVTELEMLLAVALQVRTDVHHLCVFVDGLDEYKGEDGPEGLLSRLRTIYKHPKIKMCVSSRPEKRFRRELGQVPNLRLHDLTWPEMETHTRGQLTRYTHEGIISEKVLDELTSELLNGAQCVFLWLRLALQSIKDGIHNGDESELLLARLRELPPELEELYEAMWKRVNGGISIYRESAARYFHLVSLSATSPMLAYLEGHENGDVNFVTQPSGASLFQLLCCGNAAIAGRYLDPEVKVSFDEVKDSFVTVENEIRVRCAGLLETRPPFWESQSEQLSKDTRDRVNVMGRGVNFVHRTVQEYLFNTKGGRTIMNHCRSSPTTLLFSLLQSWLCQGRLFWETCRMSTYMVYLLRGLHKVWQRDESQQSREMVLELVRTAQHFYDGDLIGEYRVEGGPKRHFLSELAHFPGLDTLVLQQAQECGASTATEILRDAWRIRSPDFVPTIQVVRRLLLEGADPWAVNVAYGNGSPRRSNAAWDFLMRRVFYNSEESEGWRVHVVEVIEALMHSQAKFLDHSALILIWPLGQGWRLWDPPRPMHPMYSMFQTPIPIFKVSTSCLLKLALDIAQHSSHSLAMLSPAPPRLRYMTVRGPSRQPMFFEIVDQRPLQGVVPILFAEPDGGLRSPPSPKTIAGWEEWRALAHSLTLDLQHDVLREITLEHIVTKFSAESTSTRL